MMPDLAMLTDAVGNVYEEKKPSLAELLALKSQADRAREVLRQVGESEIVSTLVMGMAVDIPGSVVRAALDQCLEAWYKAAFQHGVSAD